MKEKDNCLLNKRSEIISDQKDSRIAQFTRAIFVWQFLCDEFYLLGFYVANTFGQKTSLPVFMWQTKIVNYEYLFVYMTCHIFVACIYLHVCQALCNYNIALKTIFFCVESQNVCCIIYMSNHIYYGKLSNKNCSCNRIVKFHSFSQPSVTSLNRRSFISSVR